MRKLLAVVFSLGVLAAAVAGPGLAAKDPPGAEGSCGVSETSTQEHNGIFATGQNEGGQGGIVQNCLPGQKKHF
jgi:hypothetical protein